jgi:hypothetical protein
MQHKQHRKIKIIIARYIELNTYRKIKEKIKLNGKKWQAAGKFYFRMRLQMNENSNKFLLNKKKDHKTTTSSHFILSRKKVDFFLF